MELQLQTRCSRVWRTRKHGSIGRSARAARAGASHLEELYGVLTASIMVRRRKADVLTELPPKRRQQACAPLPVSPCGVPPRPSAASVTWQGGLVSAGGSLATGCSDELVGGSCTAGHTMTDPPMCLIGSTECT